MRMAGRWGVVSGGFHEIVDRLAADAHLDYHIANRLGRGMPAAACSPAKLVGDVVTKEVKLSRLRSWAQENDIARIQTVAVGDGANDLPMIGAAGLGIAFCAKPTVRTAAPHTIDERDLRKVLDFLQ